MIHLDDEQVQRLIHDEVAPTAKASLETHVEACRQCQDLVGQARAEEEQVFGLLARVDHLPPVVGVSAVMRPASSSPSPLRWAAAGLLAVGLAGAAYAIPGSPVRDWVRALVARPAPTPPPPTEPPAVPEAPIAGGIVVAPGLSFQVHFLAVQSTGEIRLTMTEGADLIVEARGAGASFTSNADQLVIDNRSSAGDFEIAIPKAAPRIEIRVGSRRVFLKDHSVIVPALPDSGPSRIALAQLGGTSP